MLFLECQSAFRQGAAQRFERVRTNAVQGIDIGFRESGELLHAGYAGCAQGAQRRLCQPVREVAG